MLIWRIPITVLAFERLKPLLVPVGVPASIVGDMLTTAAQAACDEIDFRFFDLSVVESALMTMRQSLAPHFGSVAIVELFQWMERVADNDMCTALWVARYALARAERALDTVKAPGSMQEEWKRLEANEADDANVLALIDTEPTSFERSFEAVCPEYWIAIDGFLVSALKDQRMWCLLRALSQRSEGDFDAGFLWLRRTAAAEAKRGLDSSSLDVFRHRFLALTAPDWSMRGQSGPSL